VSSAEPLRVRKRARWFRPGDWPIFVKTLLGTVAVVALALGVTTFVNARPLQTIVREIGAALGLHDVTIQLGMDADRTD
jgi:hypothetical protein